MKYIKKYIAIVIMIGSITSAGVTVKHFYNDLNKIPLVKTVAQHTEKTARKGINKNIKAIKKEIKKNKKKAKSSSKKKNNKSKKIKPYKVKYSNNPRFSNSQKKIKKNFIKLSKLDKYKRCGVSFARFGKESLPKEDRGYIGNVRPSGWHTVKYDSIPDKYLYNRCHLLAYCLSGLNDDNRNLITGTRYLNTEGMLPFELKTVRYIERTGNHVLYRVTPVFKKNELVARGVLMEAYSQEDNGKGLKFCVYCYNKQPNIHINYANGNSYEV